MPTWQLMLLLLLPVPRSSHIERSSLPAVRTLYMMTQRCPLGCLCFLGRKHLNAAGETAALKLDRYVRSRGPSSLEGRHHILGRRARVLLLIHLLSSPSASPPPFPVAPIAPAHVAAAHVARMATARMATRLYPYY
jgi:hypothetical protein